MCKSPSIRIRRNKIMDSDAGSAGRCSGHTPQGLGCGPCMFLTLQHLCLDYALRDRFAGRKWGREWGWWSRAPEMDHPNSSAARTSASPYHGHFWGWLLALLRLLPKQADTMQTHIELKKTCYREQRNPSAAMAGTAGFVFAAWCQSPHGHFGLERLQHQGHLGRVVAVRSNSPKGGRNPPCLWTGIQVVALHWHCLPPHPPCGASAGGKGKRMRCCRSPDLITTFCGNAVIIVKCFLSIFPARHQHYHHRPDSLSLQECPQGLPLHLAEQDVLV